MVGMPEHALTRAGTPYETGIARYREIARGQILGDDSGMLKLIFHAETRKLLGAHAIGTGVKSRPIVTPSKAACQRPFLLPGRVLGDDRRGQDRRDTTRLL